MTRAVTDMPDRELLELAAEAAGFPDTMEDDGGWLRVRANPVCEWELWNPLADDGDALRLAADLDLFALPEYWSMLARVRLLGGTDKYANVRRALVWTAVERYLEKKARKPVPAGEPQ